MIKAKKYQVKSIFYSLQGEGFHAGEARLFVRFANCNLSCSFCDEDFQGGREMTARQIVERMESLAPHCQSVILTGGEPLLQYDAELEKELFDYHISIETNGSIPLKHRADWVCVSPKVSEEMVRKNFPRGVDELKYVIRDGQWMPIPHTVASHIWLSPEFDGDKLNKKNVDWCVFLAKKHLCRVSIQTHKILEIP